MITGALGTPTAALAELRAFVLMKRYLLFFNKDGKGFLYFLIVLLLSSTKQSRFPLFDPVYA
jgi:hypothetical protein